MAEEKKDDKKKKSSSNPLASLFKKNGSSKGKGKSKVDPLTAIFFAIMIIGLILFTVLYIVKSNSAVYETSFGEITSTVEINDLMKTISMKVNVDDQVMKQTGKYTETDDGYKVTFDDEVVTIKINEDTLDVIYDDGSKISYKEKVNE